MTYTTMTHDLPDPGEGLHGEHITGATKPNVPVQPSAHDDDTYPEYRQSPHSGMAQGFNEPSPVVGEFQPSSGNVTEAETKRGSEDKRPASYNEQVMARAEHLGQVLNHDTLPESVNAMDTLNRKFGGR